MGRRVFDLSVLMMVVLAASAPAQEAGGKRGGGQQPVAQGQPGEPNRLVAAAAVSGGWWSWPPYYAVGTPGGFFIVMPPMVGPPIPVSIERGPIAAPPPRDWAAGPVPVAPRVVRPAVRRDAARAAQLVTVGDRLFRGDNIKKAEERYLQAARRDPQSATPLVRLAQVSLVREQYAAAAQRLREAETVQPGWIATAPDIQALYGEPGEFARHLARLESHLQVHPEDRDAWLVLGAEWFLSGRTARAGDVFRRLDDPRRKPDIALAAFLQASRRE